MYTFLEPDCMSWAGPVSRDGVSLPKSLRFPTVHCISHQPGWLASCNTDPLWGSTSCPLVNNSTVQQLSSSSSHHEIRGPTHPLKNLRTFSDGTVRRKMMNHNDFTGQIFKRIGSWCVILRRYACFRKMGFRPDNPPRFLNGKTFLSSVQRKMNHYNFYRDRNVTC